MIREAAAEDARAVLVYLESISGESNFLGFGRGEFEPAEPEEETVPRSYQDSNNQVYIHGLIDETVVSTLIFSAGRRSRVRLSGEFCLSMRKQSRGFSIGSLMIDTLIDWAKDIQIVKKINLHVRTDNQRAISLYERKGFVKEGAICGEVFLDGEYYDHLWMGLAL